MKLPTFVTILIIVSEINNNVKINTMLSKDYTHRVAASNLKLVIADNYFSNNSVEKKKKIVLYEVLYFHEILIICKIV